MSVTLIGCSGGHCDQCGTDRTIWLHERGEKFAVSSVAVRGIGEDGSIWAKNGWRKEAFRLENATTQLYIEGVCGQGYISLQNRD